jgi:hypothetical protein
MLSMVLQKWLEKNQVRESESETFGGKKKRDKAWGLLCC